MSPAITDSTTGTIKNAQTSKVNTSCAKNRDDREPAARVARILRDTLHDGALGDRLPLVETFSSSLLREIPQIANLNFADEDGNFVLVRGGHDDGIDVKLVENVPGPRRVTWIHRNAAGDEVGREEDPTDTYDPRTRSWYEGALANDHLFWTGIYIFFSQRVPGITASAKYRNPNGRLYLFGVDITLDALSHFLGSLEIGRTGRAVIIDDTGQLIASPRGSAMLRQIKGELAALRIDELGDDVLTHAYDHDGAVRPGRAEPDVPAADPDQPAGVRRHADQGRRAQLVDNDRGAGG